jgi:hypothetical protein
VENVVKKNVVFLFLILAITGCSNKPKIWEIANEMEWKRAEICVIAMPYAVNTDDKEGFLALSKTNWRIFLQKMEGELKQHIQGHKLGYNITIRKAVDSDRPTKECGDGESKNYGGGVPGERNYEECLTTWAEKILTGSQKEDFCPPNSNIALMGAQLYGYKNEPIEIRTMIKKLGKETKVEVGSSLKSSSEFLQAAKDKKIDEMGRLAGKELSELLERVVK